MHLIFEGVHDVGKSTLINKFIETYKEKFIKFDCRRKFGFSNSRLGNISDFAIGANFSISFFLNNLTLDRSIIFDRLHLSEYAYSRVIRGMQESEALERFEIVDCNLTSNVCLIYLCNSLEVINSRMKKRNKHYDELETLKLIDKLDVAYEMSKMNKIKILTDDIEDNFKTIINHLGVQ